MCCSLCIFDIVRKKSSFIAQNYYFSCIFAKSLLVLLHLRFAIMPKMLYLCSTFANVLRHCHACALSGVLAGARRSEVGGESRVYRIPLHPIIYYVYYPVILVSEL